MAKIHFSMLHTMAAACLLAACSGQDATTLDQQSALHGNRPDEHGLVGHRSGHDVTVMTRNLFLGADLQPAIGAGDVFSLVQASGAILRQVTVTNFPVRAKGLSDEILRAKPDLVGLQECALWRTQPVDFGVLTAGPSAKHVRYDFLELLLDRLNAGKKRYRAVAVEKEFDFEAPANEDDNVATGAPGTGADINGRLTMRDVILARVDSGVHVWQPEGGHYTNLLTVSLLGGSLPVTRGWVEVEARVRGGLHFRFVDTHLEAYDKTGTVREAQAGELFAAGGPASRGRVVLVGDLNSGNASDHVSGSDQLAYSALVDNGFYERSTNDPFSCCIQSETLRTGTAAMFDHRVDHIMTNAPRTVRLVDSFVTGREMHHGYWDSDHAGVVSELRIH